MLIILLRFCRLGSKGAKEGQAKDAEASFKTYSLGVVTARDEIAYDFDYETLAKRIEEVAEESQCRGRPLQSSEKAT